MQGRWVCDLTWRPQGSVEMVPIRRRREAAPLAQTDADALVRGHSDDAYRMARDFERDVVLTQRNNVPGPNRPLIGDVSQS